MVVVVIVFSDDRGSGRIGGGGNITRLAGVVGIVTALVAMAMILVVCGT